MDLNTVATLRRPTDRDELFPLGPGERPLAGGSWLFSEPQPEVTGLVDLQGLAWPALTVTDDGLTVAATCTIAELADAGARLRHRWPAAATFRPAAEALLGSFKVHGVATVGGNLCLALPAGPMTSLTAGLDGVAVVWMPDGTDRRLPVAELVRGVQQTALGPGEVLRAVELPAAALAGRAAFRQLSLSPTGRSAAVVLSRLAADGTFACTVTAATPAPVRLAFAGVPSPAQLDAAVAAIPQWYDDPHGAPDWRRHITRGMAAATLAELTATSGTDSAGRGFA